MLPGAVAVVGGLLLVISRNRATAMLGGWLGVVAGAWFVVGRVSAGLLGIGDVGAPVAATESKALALELAYFYGLGALIVFLGAAALGRISVRSVRDVEYVDNPVSQRMCRRSRHSRTPTRSPRFSRRGLLRDGTAAGVTHSAAYAPSTDIWSFRRSHLARGLLRELYARRQAEFVVDVAQMRLHRAW